MQFSLKQLELIQNGLITYAAVLDDNIVIKKPVQQWADEAHTRIDLKKLIYDIDIVIQKEKQKQDA